MLDLANIFTPRFILHLVLHVMLPLIIAFLFYRGEFRKAALLMLAGILIDVDHVVADPIVNPDRCSVGYHFLHSYWLVPLYGLLAVTFILLAVSCLPINQNWKDIWAGECFSLASAIKIFKA